MSGGSQGGHEEDKDKDKDTDEDEIEIEGEDAEEREKRKYLARRRREFRSAPWELPYEHDYGDEVPMYVARYRAINRQKREQRVECQRYAEEVERERVKAEVADMFD